MDTLRELLGGSTLPSTDATLPPFSPESKRESRISSDTHDLLCHSMERLFKSGLKPIRYQSVLSFSEVDGDSGKNHDDGFTLSDYRSGTTSEDACCSDGGTQHFALLSELDLDFSEDLDVDIRDHHELPAEDDPETLGGSQEFEDDLFYSDDEGSVEEPDEDFWPSSESTIKVRKLSRGSCHVAGQLMLLDNLGPCLRLDRLSLGIFSDL
ncbi:hypothetical protein BD413DRAFT_152874 [Trametes elegans]|nr:hypothetical protein BD413DRAFT_152874 [Trametes elegans]